jgi:hypothetical protein
MGVSIAILCMVGALAGTSGASTPTAATDSASGGSSAAVVTPLLEFFVFGNTVGLPLLCADAGSVATIIGSTSGIKAVSPLTVQLDKECSELSSEGNGYLQKAIAESQALSLINPAVNPLIADLANGLVTVGTQYGPSLAPFGPTVAGLGGTVAFFEGS